MRRPVSATTSLRGLPEMFMGLWAWRLAKFFGIAGILLLIASPAWATVQAGDVRFDLGQVCIFVAMGMAWGDLRHRMYTLEADFKQFKQDRG